MRNTFIRTLTSLAEADERIVLLTGDLGFMVVEPFADRFPDRFFNVGVAEQNMVAVATGMAEAGFVPYCYSIVTFAALRAYEFFRNGPVLQQLPVRLVGVGGGFEYGHAGPTHHGYDDIGAMRVQRDLIVAAPADFEQTEAAVRAIHDRPGPAFLRLGKDERTVVPGLDGRFDLGRAHRVREGADVVLVALGPSAVDAIEAADLLADHGIAAAVVVVSSVEPAPVHDLASFLAAASLAVSVESHSVVGGLGSLVAEVIAESGLPVRLVRCGLRSVGDRGGSDAYLRSVHGLAPAQLAATVAAQLEGRT